MSRKLTLADIADLRAYENERPAYLARIMEMKKHRRVSVGPYVTFIFENRETMRFQIQEMARVEKLIRDEQIIGELEAYNPLIPEPGELSTTMMIELRNNEELREWLPRLVGIERTAYVRIGDKRAPAEVDEIHAGQLTRDEITSSVHYVRFRLTEAQAEAFAREPVAIGLDHPHYVYETPLTEETRESLLADVRE